MWPYLFSLLVGGPFLLIQSYNPQPRILYAVGIAVMLLGGIHLFYQWWSKYMMVRTVQRNLDLVGTRLNQWESDAEKDLKQWLGGFKNHAG